MKRYLVFAGDYYYPNGGMDDFQDCFNEFKMAQKFTDSLSRYDWYHVYDLVRKCIIYDREN